MVFQRRHTGYRSDNMHNHAVGKFEEYRISGIYEWILHILHVFFHRRSEYAISLVRDRTKMWHRN